MAVEATPAFAPYVVQTGGLDDAQVVQFCEDVNTGHRAAGLVSPFALYDDILSFLLRSDAFEIKPLGELSKPIGPKKRRGPDLPSRVGLRHDMDGDIVTGLKCAQRLSARRIPGTFYVLHTSGYYGLLEEGVFTRYDGLTPIIEGFAGLRTEFGLHNDGFMFYQNGIDGTQAVTTELAWLRSLGVPTTSVVAHNSAPVYGAENFEMFEGLSLHGRTACAHNGVTIPLQTLSLAQQALAYEGNFSLPPRADTADLLAGYLSDIAGAQITDPKWQTLHFLNNPTFERDYDVSIWLLAEDSWMLAYHPNDRVFGPRTVHWPLTTSELKRHLSGLLPGLRIMLNIHPEYIAL